MSLATITTLSQAQQPALRNVALYDALAFDAVALPHCNEVGLQADGQLLGLLTRREALDLANRLIKSVERLRQPAEIQREGLERFDQEFGTPLAVAHLESEIGPAIVRGGQP